MKKNTAALIDISKPLRNSMAVWPGNIPFQLDLIKKHSADHMQDSNISLNSHTGTHIDAPLHAIEKGNSIEKIPLQKFIGPALVLNIEGCREINARLLESKCKNKKVDNLLLRTDYSLISDEIFDQKFPAITLDAAEWIIDKEISLIGIDSPSIQQYEERQNAIHISLLKNKVLILENLLLKNITEGMYYLIAFPLPVKGAEAAPVRAVLMDKF